MEAPTREGRHGWCWASLSAHAARRSHGRREGSVKRSILRSLCASSVALFTYLVTAAAALAASTSDPDPCLPAPAPPGGTCQPAGITAGPDGNIWFTEENGNRIGRITPGGVITEFTAGLDGRRPAGRDQPSVPGRKRSGSQSSGAQQDRRDHDRPASITEYPSRSSGAPGRNHRRARTGRIWFTEFWLRNQTAHRPDATGGTLIDRVPPDRAAAPVTSPLAPTAGSGSPRPSGKVGAISTERAGRMPLSRRRRAGSDPSGITASGGSLWFTEHGANQIRRIDHGVVTGDRLPVGSGTIGDRDGLDGRSGSPREIAGRIGRITTSGVLTNEFAGLVARQPAGRDHRRARTARSGSRSSSATRSAGSRRRRGRRPAAATATAASAAGGFDGEEVQGAEAARPDGEKGQEQAQEGQVQVQDSWQGKGQVHRAQGRSDHDQASDSEVQA